MNNEEETRKSLLERYAKVRDKLKNLDDLPGEVRDKFRLFDALIPGYEARCARGDVTSPHQQRVNLELSGFVERMELTYGLALDIFVEDRLAQYGLSGGN